MAGNPPELRGLPSAGDCNQERLNSSRTPDVRADRDRQHEQLYIRTFRLDDGSKRVAEYLSSFRSQAAGPEQTPRWVANAARTN